MDFTLRSCAIFVREFKCCVALVVNFSLICLTCITNSEYNVVGIVILKLPK